MNTWTYLMPLPLPHQWILTWSLRHLVRFILTLIFLIVDVIIFPVCDSEPSPPSVAQMAGPSGGPEAHKFTIRYHPNSGHLTETQCLDNHSRKLSPPCNLEPWSPFFQSCKDFEIAEVIMKLGVPKADCNHIFKAFRWCLDGWGSFNLNKY
jgi:hypothetical protein